MNRLIYCITFGLAATFAATAIAQIDLSPWPQYRANSEKSGSVNSILKA